MSETFLALVHSRKVWIAIGDALVAIISLVGARVLSPDDLKFALALVAILQIPASVVIGAIAWEDGKAWESGARSAQLE